MNIKVLKLALDADDRISPELKEALLEKTEILFEFHEHMKSTYDLNDQEAEALSKAYVGPRIVEGTREELSEVMENLATHYKFDRPKEFSESIVNLITLLEPGF